jgi:hypothetical protein
MRINDNILKETESAGPGQASADKAKARPGKPVAAGGRDGKSTRKAAAKKQPAKSGKTGGTKSEIVLKKLRSAKGVTIEALMEATGWQAHSVRGFLSAVVKKKLGLALVSETGKDGTRRYRLDDAARAG